MNILKMKKNTIWVSDLCTISSKRRFDKYGFKGSMMQMKSTWYCSISFISTSFKSIFLLLCFNHTSILQGRSVKARVDSRAIPHKISSKQPWSTSEINQQSRRAFVFTASNSWPSLNCELSESRVCIFRSYVFLRFQASNYLE